MKLISMTNFILENYPKGLGSIFYHSHAEFLSQKLELWMFVPCKLVDGVWVVLEEPKQYLGALEFAYGECYDKALEYQEAKDRVLFEGFSICDKKHVQNGNIFIGLGFKNGIYQTVEDLIKHVNWSKKDEIILTPTAQKQFLP